MNTLLEIAARNALGAVLLAVAVVLLTPFIRRPAVRHALWLIVLARLLLPPIWGVALPIGGNENSSTAQATAERTASKKTPSVDAVSPGTDFDRPNTVAPIDEADLLPNARALSD